MKLARFLAEISVRARRYERFVAEPVGALVLRICGTLDRQEGRALAKACIAVIECEGNVSDADLEALSPDSIVLLDRFASERLRLHYQRRELDLVAATVKDLLGGHEQVANSRAHARTGGGFPNGALRLAENAVHIGAISQGDHRLVDASARVRGRQALAG